MPFSERQIIWDRQEKCLGFAIRHARLWKIEKLHVLSVSIINSREQITKTLIKLRGCTVWSVHLLLVFNKVRFSRDQTNFIKEQNSSLNK